MCQLLPQMEPSRAQNFHYTSKIWIMWLWKHKFLVSKWISFRSSRFRSTSRANTAFKRRTCQNNIDFKCNLFKISYFNRCQEIPILQSYRFPYPNCFYWWCNDVLLYPFKTRLKSMIYLNIVITLEKSQQINLSLF